MTVMLLVLAGAVLVAYLVRREARLRWLRGSGRSASLLLGLVFKSTALAMGAISLLAAVFGQITIEAHLVLLSLGLLALALGVLQKSE